MKIRNEINSYLRASEYLGNRNSRTIPSKRSTSINRESATEVYVQYHGTRVVTFHADGRIVLRSGGYHTVTTKRRYKEHVPWSVANVYQEDFEWYVSTGGTQGNPQEFYEGFTAIDTAQAALYAEVNEWTARQNSQEIAR